MVNNQPAAYFNDSGDASSELDPALKAKLRSQLREEGIQSKVENNSIMLDERPSKKINRMSKGYLRDAASTSKVVDELNRKAAQSPAGTSRGIIRKSLSSSPNRFTSEELKILEAPHEIAVRYDKENRISKITQGDDRSVTFPSTKKGDTVTHNHPRGLGPSDADLAKLLTYSASELRIVGKQHGSNVLYRIISKNSVSAEKASEIITFYKETMKNKNGKIVNTILRRDKALALTLDKYGSIFTADKFKF